jgi:hypothetical protein
MMYLSKQNINLEFTNMKTTNENITIVGCLEGNQIGVIDSDGKFSTNSKLDFNSRKFFDSVEDAEIYISKLNKSENNSPDFSYKVEVDF